MSFRRISLVEHDVAHHAVSEQMIISNIHEAVLNSLHTQIRLDQFPAILIKLGFKLASRVNTGCTRVSHLQFINRKEFGILFRRNGL